MKKVLSLAFLILLYWTTPPANAGESPQIIVQTGHYSIYDFALSPDGMWLAVLGSDTFNKTTCKIYNIESKRLFGEIDVEKDLHFVFFTSDGNDIIVSDSRLKDGVFEIPYKIYNVFDKKLLKEGLVSYNPLGNGGSIPKQQIDNKNYHFIGRRLAEEGISFYNKVNLNLNLMKNYERIGDVIFELSRQSGEGVVKEYDLKITYNNITYQINNVKEVPTPILSNNRFFVASDNNSFLYIIDLKSTKVFTISRSYVSLDYLTKYFDKYLVSYSYRDNLGWIIWDINNASLLMQIDKSVNDPLLKKYIEKAPRDNENDLLLTENKVLSADKNLYAQVSFPAIALFDSKTNKEVARCYYFTDGEWIVITPDGYYNASPNGDKYLNVRIGNNVYGIENYREAFYRPDIVKLALSGSSIKDLKTIAEVKQPPLVSMVNTPSNTDKDEIKVTLKLEDQGGGIGDIRLYLNGSAVILDSTRGISLNPKEGEKVVFKEYTIKLTNGENNISAVAFNKENSMQSNPATFKITADLNVIRKPSLYAVVIGINEYKNPKLTLKYAVADANLFADTLNEIAGRMFDNVVIKRLTTSSDTTKEAIKKVMDEMKQLNPDDLFVFYVAAHGTIDEGDYFLLTSNVGSVSTYKLKEDALTQGELKELIANVPSTKKMVIIDTCNAGKLGEVLQSALLTRGMSEDVAMKILSRAVGSTIIAASTSLQEAIEGYNNHGLFTYILSEGLKGKADSDKDGFIKTIELANYVDSEVPAIAEKVFNHPQYPTVTPIGTSFPIGKVK